MNLTKYGNLKLAEARTLFLLENDLPADGGQSDRPWCVRLGALELRLPAFEWRRRAVPYHDLHHIITGYPCTPAGEVQAAAWEFAAGRYRNPLATLFCLPLIAMGALRWPVRTFRAFLRGRGSSTLYAETITEQLLATRVSALQERMLPDASGRATLSDMLAYCGLLAASFALVASPAAAAALIYFGVTT